MTKFWIILRSRGERSGQGSFPTAKMGKIISVTAKKLFDLNGAVFLGTLATVILLEILVKKGQFVPTRPFGKHYTLSCGVGMLGIFALIGGLAALSFDKAFVVFHRLFFPGKDNWIFNPAKDGIIEILPEEFFLSCGVLIIGSVILLSVIMILYGIIEKKLR